MRDLVEMQFGRLTVLEFSHKRNRKTFWKCQCECGNIRTVYRGNLTSGNSRSCGCLMLDLVSTHGHTSRKKGITPEYQVWAGMKQRCENPKSNFFERYGGRGIKVCKRWMKFENFIKDMGFRPSKEHSIERKNNDKGYSPSNCQWATSKVQSRNTSRNVWITANGRTQCLNDWAKEIGRNPNTLAMRLKYGMPPEMVVSAEDLYKYRYQRLKGGKL